MITPPTLAQGIGALARGLQAPRPDARDLVRRARALALQAEEVQAGDEVRRALEDLVASLVVASVAGTPRTLQTAIEEARSALSRVRNSASRLAV